MRIVLLDSDKPFIDEFTERCHKCGVDLRVFAQLDQAFEEVKKQPDLIDVVLITREVSGKDNMGFELATKLRAEAKTAEVPYVILSGVLSNTDFSKHQKGTDGANAYLKKPVMIQTLISTMETVTGLKFPSEKKVPVKKAAPKVPMPGLNIVLTESRKILNVFETIPTTARLEEELTFFPDEEPTRPSLIQEEIKGFSDVPSAPAAVVPAAAVEPVVSTALSAPVTAPAEELSGVEINLSEGSFEIQSNSGTATPVASVVAEQVKVEAAPAAAEVPVSEAIEVTIAPGPAAAPEPATAPEPAAPAVEEKILTSISLDKDEVEDLNLDAPASFDANSTAPKEEPAEPVAETKQTPQAVSDEKIEEDLPYLFGGPSSHTGQVAQKVSEKPQQVEGPDFSKFQTGSGDMETMKRYLMMREQEIAILSAQLSYAKEELSKSEGSIKSLNMQVEDLLHKLDDKDQRITNFEKEIAHADRSKEGEIEQLKSEIKAKTDRAKFLDEQLTSSNQQYEKLRERVRQDIRKIRVREKELENKLEILKKDSETLIAARESKILELKRRIDLLEFNYDALADQNEAEKSNVKHAHEKIAKVVKVLRLAIGIIEGEADQKDLENDVKAA